MVKKSKILKSFAENNDIKFINIDLKKWPRPETER